MNRYGSEAHFNGRVGVIIEVAPNKFVQYVLKGVQGSIEMSRDVEPLPADGGAWATYRPAGPAMVTMELSGQLVSQDQAERPVWVPAEPTGEIEARRELERR